MLFAELGVEGDCDMPCPETFGREAEPLVGEVIDDAPPPEREETHWRSEINVNVRLFKTHPCPDLVVCRRERVVVHDGCLHRDEGQHLMILEAGRYT